MLLTETGVTLDPAFNVPHSCDARLGDFLRGTAVQPKAEVRYLRPRT